MFIISDNWERWVSRTEKTLVLPANIPDGREREWGGGKERCLMLNKSRVDGGVCLQRVLGLTVRVVGRGGHDNTGQTETQAGTQKGTMLLLFQTARVEPETLTFPRGVSVCKRRLSLCVH